MYNFVINCDQFSIMYFSHFTCEEKKFNNLKMILQFKSKMANKKSHDGDLGLWEADWITEVLHALLD